MVSIGRYIATIIISIIFLSIAAAIYPSFAFYMALALEPNIIGTGMFFLSLVLYWVITSMLLILLFINGFQLNDLKNFLDGLLD